jgi:hypothetical protein
MPSYLCHTCIKAPITYMIFADTHHVVLSFNWIDPQFGYGNTMLAWAPPLGLASSPTRSSSCTSPPHLRRRSLPAHIFLLYFGSSWAGAEQIAAPLSIPTNSGHHSSIPPRAPPRARRDHPFPLPSGDPPPSSSFYAVSAEIHKRSPTSPILCCRLSADSVAEAPSINPR